MGICLKGALHTLACGSCAFTQLIVRNSYHFHREYHAGPPIQAVGGNLDLPLVSVNDLLADCEPEPNSLVIKTVRVVQLAELLEKLLQVFLLDATACVFHVHHKQALDEIVA